MSRRQLLAELFLVQQGPFGRVSIHPPPLLCPRYRDWQTLIRDERKAVPTSALTRSNIVFHLQCHWITLARTWLSSLQALSSMPESSHMLRRHRDYEDSSGSCNSSGMSDLNTDEEEESTSDIRKKVSIEVRESKQKVYERTSKSEIFF